MSIDPEEVARILGGERVLGHYVRTLPELYGLVAEGLPVSSLNETVRYVAGSGRAARALKDRLVPRATRSRRTRLKLAESERVERLARSVAMAEAVWENREDALAFIHAPHPMLDDKSPLEMADSELGARRVEQLLLRLEYNLPA